MEERNSDENKDKHKFQSQEYGAIVNVITAKGILCGGAISMPLLIRGHIFLNFLQKESRSDYVWVM
jgi:hypothetical protein